MSCHTCCASLSPFWIHAILSALGNTFCFTRRFIPSAFAFAHAWVASEICANWASFVVDPARRRSRRCCCVATASGSPGTTCKSDADTTTVVALTSAGNTRRSCISWSTERWKPRRCGSCPFFKASVRPRNSGHRSVFACHPVVWVAKQLRTLHKVCRLCHPPAKKICSLNEFHVPHHTPGAPLPRATGQSRAVGGSRADDAMADGTKQRRASSSRKGLWYKWHRLSTNTEGAEITFRPR